MRRMLVAAIFGVGLLAGAAATRWFPVRVEAQTAWQCKSWMNQRDSGDAAAIGTWLGNARSVQVSAAGLSQSGLHVMLACKQ